MLGKAVPDFSLPSTGGTDFKLSAQRGAKPVLCFQRFPFELLADPDEAVCRQFAVMQLKTPVREESPRHPKGWRGVKVPGHAQEVLNFVKAL
jgi:peroxiredoxin